MARKKSDAERNNDFVVVHLKLRGPMLAQIQKAVSINGETYPNVVRQALKKHLLSQ